MDEDGAQVRAQLHEDRSDHLPGVAVVPPDLGALYLRYCDAMHRVAASVLREVGLADAAGDAVHEAIVSIMRSPPGDVRDWEAFLVAAAKRKALDRVRSAAVRHAGPEAHRGS